MTETSRARCLANCVFASLLGVAVAATARSECVGSEGDPAREHSKMFPFRQSGTGGKWGYMDQEGRTLIKPRFDGCNPFAEGRAFARRGDGWGCIDEKGKFLFEGPQGCDRIKAFSEGLAAIRIDGRWGYIQRDGTIVVRPKYDNAASFSEGLAWIAVGAKRYPSTRPTVVIGGRYGFIDKKGREVIKPQFNAAGNFSNGLAWVYLENRTAFINKNGEVAVRLRNSPLPGRSYEANDFSEGLARIVMHEIRISGDEYVYTCLAGFVDNSGSFVFEPQWKGLTDFSEGRATYVDGEEHVCIDPAGRVVGRLRCDEMRDFSEGLAAVRVGDSWGYVDKQMRWAIHPKGHEAKRPGPINDAKDFRNGLTRVHIGGVRYRPPAPHWEHGVWFYMNTNGAIVRRICSDEESPGYGM